MNYDFPVDDVFQAREVLEVDFQIKDHPELFVDLDKVRIQNKFQNYKTSIKRALNIDGNKLNNTTSVYKKILFTGYRGSGKSTELYKLYEQELNGAEKYFTVFIDLEQEFDMGGFRYQDFFFILIYKFLSFIDEQKEILGVKTAIEILNDLLEEIVSEVEIKKIHERSANLGVEASAGTGFNIFNLFKAKVDLKAEFATGSSLAKEIRRKIDNNPLDIIRKFNNEIEKIRPAIIEAKKGKDILFIVDSLERVNFEVYRDIIVKNRYVLQELQANLIIAIPINAKFFLNDVQDRTLYEDFVLPVIKVDKKQNREALAEVIQKRIKSEKFFENDDVLDYLVKMSGGVIRQLLRLTAFNLLYAEKLPLTMQEAEEITEEYGRQLFEALDSKQTELLKKINKKEKEFKPADKLDSLLMQNLYILKYNGVSEINPLIKKFIDE